MAHLVPYLTLTGRPCIYRLTYSTYVTASLPQQQLILDSTRPNGSRAECRVLPT